MIELKEWANRHLPNPREKLAAKSEVSFRVVMNLFMGRAPRLTRTRFKLARAMEKPLEAVFHPKKKTRSARKSA